MASVTWVCPSCGRRVPNRVDECHCGTRRDVALRTADTGAALSATGVPAPPVPPAHRFSWRGLPRDIKWMAVGLVLTVLLGVAFMFRPWRPKPIHPLLGWSAPAPRPTPLPAHRPAPDGRAGKPSPSP